MTCKKTQIYAVFLIQIMFFVVNQCLFLFFLVRQ